MNSFLAIATSAVLAALTPYSDRVAPTPEMPAKQCVTMLMSSTTQGNITYLKPAKNAPGCHGIVQYQMQINGTFHDLMAIEVVMGNGEKRKMSINGVSAMLACTDGNFNEEQLVAK